MKIWTSSSKSIWLKLSYFDKGFSKNLFSYLFLQDFLFALLIVTGERSLFLVQKIYLANS